LDFQGQRTDVGRSPVRHDTSPETSPSWPREVSLEILPLWPEVPLAMYNDVQSCDDPGISIVRKLDIKRVLDRIHEQSLM